MIFPLILTLFLFCLKVKKHIFLLLNEYIYFLFSLLFFCHVNFFNSYSDSIFEFIFDYSKKDVFGFIFYYFITFPFLIFLIFYIFCLLISAFIECEYDLSWMNFPQYDSSINIFSSFYRYIQYIIFTYFISKIFVFLLKVLEQTNDIVAFIVNAIFIVVCFFLISIFDKLESFLGNHKIKIKKI